MTILAFDASTLACSACIWRDGAVIASRYLNTGLTHSQTLLPLIEGVLNDSETTLDRIDRIAVAVGPGSFTGIKIAVATAKGLAHKNKTPCVAVSSPEALAHGIEFDGTVCAVEDARRGMLYNANFKNGVRCTEDRQISVDALLEETEGPLYFCGDGSAIAKRAADAAGRVSLVADGLRALIRAEEVAEIGARASESDLVSPDMLEPKHLRLPQAERERLEKESKTSERN